MTVEKVTLFRSSDGVLHETEQLCLARNFMLESRPKIMVSLTENANFLDDQPGTMNIEAVCDWVLKCTPEIIAILTPLVNPIDAPRRRRRTKADMALEKAAQTLLQAQNGNKSIGVKQTQSLEEFAAKEAQMLAGDSAGEVRLEQAGAAVGIPSS